MMRRTTHDVLIVALVASALCMADLAAALRPGFRPRALLQQAEAITNNLCLVNPPDGVCPTNRDDSGPSCYDTTLEKGCSTLLAGQTTVVGSVCLALDNSGQIQATYKVDPGYEIKEAQLWASTCDPTTFQCETPFDAAQGPWSDVGRAAPGQLAWVYSGLPAGTTEYTFPDHENLNDPSSYDDASYDGLKISDYESLKNPGIGFDLLTDKFSCDAQSGHVVINTASLASDNSGSLTVDAYNTIPTGQQVVGVYVAAHATVQSTAGGEAETAYPSCTGAQGGCLQGAKNWATLMVAAVQCGGCEVVENVDSGTTGDGDGLTGNDAATGGDDITADGDDAAGTNGGDGESTVGDDGLCNNVCPDNDGDGYVGDDGACTVVGAVDCDDNNDAIYPGATIILGPLQDILGVECTGNSGAHVVFSVHLNECSGFYGPPAVCDTTSGDHFSMGSTSVTCEGETFDVTVVDTVPPEVNVPASGAVAAECTGDATPVSFHVAAFDTCNGVLDVVCSSDADDVSAVEVFSGSGFALGLHPVSCTAVDGSGNTATGGFTVTVEDTVAPEIFVSDDVVTECTGDLTPASFNVAAFDTCDGVLDAVCSSGTDADGNAVEVLSGSGFALGEHTVSCTAADGSGNTAITKEFTVTVEDKVAPEIFVSDDVVTQCTGDLTPASFNVAAFDTCDGVLDAVCSSGTDADGNAIKVSPGSGFALGLHPVSCTAADGSDNTAITKEFTVTVQDKVAPEIFVSDDVVTECTGDLTPVSFNVAAFDTCDGVLDAVCSSGTDADGNAVEVLSGSGFALGEHTVSCTAADGSGNDGEKDFSVKVVDTMAPEIISMVASPASLWPPKKDFVLVTIEAETADTCQESTPVVCNIISEEITSSDTDATGFFKDVDGMELKLMRDASRSSVGRAYQIPVQCCDESGNCVSRNATVAVSKGDREVSGSFDACTSPGGCDEGPPSSPGGGSPGGGNNQDDGPAPPNEAPGGGDNQDDDPAPPPNDAPEGPLSCVPDDVCGGEDVLDLNLCTYHPEASPFDAGQTGSLNSYYFKFDASPGEPIEVYGLTSASGRNTATVTVLGQTFDVHVSCSDLYPDGWGESDGPIEGQHPKVLEFRAWKYSVNKNSGCRFVDQCAGGAELGEKQDNQQDGPAPPNEAPEGGDNQDDPAPLNEAPEGPLFCVPDDVCGGEDVLDLNLCTYHPEASPFDAGETGSLNSYYFKFDASPDEPIEVYGLTSASGRNTATVTVLGQTFDVHVSCSDLYPDGWGESDGPIEGQHPKVLEFRAWKYSVNRNSGCRFVDQCAGGAELGKKRRRSLLETAAGAAPDGLKSSVEDLLLSLPDVVAVDVNVTESDLPGKYTVSYAIKNLTPETAQQVMTDLSDLSTLEQALSLAGGSGESVALAARTTPMVVQYIDVNHYSSGGITAAQFAIAIGFSGALLLAIFVGVLVLIHRTTKQSNADEMSQSKLFKTAFWSRLRKEVANEATPMSKCDADEDPNISKDESLTSAASTPEPKACWA